jgi:hypothetical protein
VVDEIFSRGAIAPNRKRSAFARVFHDERDQSLGF